MSDCLFAGWRPGVTMEGAAARLDVLSRQLAAAYPSDNRNQVTTGRLSRLSLSTGPQTTPRFATFTGFLLTVRHGARHRLPEHHEHAARARSRTPQGNRSALALGANRSRVIRQLLTESLLLAPLAALGLVFSYWAMRIFLSSLGTTLPFTLTRSTPNKAVLAATVVFAAIGTYRVRLGTGARSLTSRSGLRPGGSQSGSAGSGRRFTEKERHGYRAGGALARPADAGGVFTRTTDCRRWCPEYNDGLKAGASTPSWPVSTQTGRRDYASAHARDRSPA